MPITERTREDHDYNLAIQDMLKTLLLNINEGDVINLVQRMLKYSGEALLSYERRAGASFGDKV